MLAEAATVASDDEWDTVELPVFPVKKQEVTTMEKTEPLALKNEGVFPIVKDEKMIMMSSAENEPIAIDDECFPRDGGFMIEGTRPPLVEQPQRAWRRNDPTYEAMMEQRDLLAAQRKSERIQCTSYQVVELLSLLERGRLIWREAHHPRFLRVLLQAKVTEGNSVNSPPTGKERTRAPAANYLFLSAVTAAKSLGEEARSSLHAHPSLAPTWVTASKDTAKNKTSAAATVLIQAINSYLSLEPHTPSTSDEVSSSSAAKKFAHWEYPISPKFLYHVLRRRDHVAGVTVPHTLYFAVMFVALCSLSGLRSRLVIAKQQELTANAETISHGGVGEDSAAQRQKVSIFPRKPKMKHFQSGDLAELRSKKLPSSCFWAEVWSAERGCFISVNPCADCTTLWGSPYTFSIAGDVVMDVTPRYISKYSSAFAFNRRLGRCNQFSFLWRDKLNWDDNREISEILLESFSKSMTSATRELLSRERQQLESLAYSEAMPTTLAALHRHPLFVIESDLAKHEGIYPKDASTIVGCVKGNTVYKRSAIVNLRSRDGWLRECRSLIDEESPAYKSVPPPASRPFASPSMFYGMWQTKPFEPVPLRPDGNLPLHGRTGWYILLDRTPASGLAHLVEPQIVRVARRMQLDFRLAVMGFVHKRLVENRRGRWEAQIDGIVVKETDRPQLLHAYCEWLRLVQEQETAKRRQRAYHGWLTFSQRILAMDRLHQQYLKGVSIASMPSA